MIEIVSTLTHSCSHHASDQPVGLTLCVPVYVHLSQLEGAVEYEVEMHRLLQHKHIVQLLETFVTWPGTSTL